MNYERMRNAVRVMEEVDKNRKPFDMSSWFWDHSEPMNCGTTACFAGWLCRDPWFKKEGLKITLDCLPIYDGCQSVDAIAELFDIDHYEAGRLTLPRWYCDETCNIWDIQPRQVIDRLLEMIAREKSDAS